MDSIKVGGVYRHYKTGGDYELVGFGRIEATLEEVVFYKSLQASKGFPAGTVWVRPITSFLETTEFEGKTIPRFTIVA